MLEVVYVVAAALAALVVWGFNPVARWRYRHLPGPKPGWLLGECAAVLLPYNAGESLLGA